MPDPPSPHPGTRSSRLTTSGPNRGPPGYDPSQQRETASQGLDRIIREAIAAPRAPLPSGSHPLPTGRMTPAEKGMEEVEKAKMGKKKEDDEDDENDEDDEEEGGKGEKKEEGRGERRVGVRRVGDNGDKERLER